MSEYVRVGRSPETVVAKTTARTAPKAMPTKDSAQFARAQVAKQATLQLLRDQAGKQAALQLFGEPTQKGQAFWGADLVQKKDAGDEEEDVLQGKFDAVQRVAETGVEEKQGHMQRENSTGMPDLLKAGVENLSRLSMDEVRVHFNSSMPAKVGALAYTQGRDIHVAPGQERHLPHEAWHVVQQAQGRVRPTFQLKGLGGVGVNDDAELEHEADIMGGRALATKTSSDFFGGTWRNIAVPDQGIVQGSFLIDGKRYNREWIERIMKLYEGAARFLVEEITLKVGQESWEVFLTRLVEPKEHELADNDRQIIKILYRAYRDFMLQKGSESSLDLTPQESFSLSVSTHNLEKFGKRTENRDQKAKLEMELILGTSPDVAVMQEVTRSDLFEEATRTNPDFSTQYKFMHGPSFISGTYHESYPAAFNRGTVHFLPVLFYIDPNTGESRTYRQTLSFGKALEGQPEREQARPTTFWEFVLPAARNLRPAYKCMGSAEKAIEYAIHHKNLRHRRNAPYFKVRLVNVHTSPSISTINRQVEYIMHIMEKLRRSDPNVIASGDFYMQKGAKRFWRTLTNRSSSPFRVIHPGVPTNFKKGRGVQIADHFVVPSTWVNTSVQALPPTPGGKLEDWEKYHIDHAFVSGIASVPVIETEPLLEIFLKKFFLDQYRQNNCLIYAIAEAADVILTEQTIRSIRNHLDTGQGVQIGNFIEANEENIKVIMQELGIYGTVQITNVENADHAPLPIFVEAQGRQGREVNISIYYSSSHFFAQPLRNA